ncbi:DUF4269 domain-containing protein [Myroides sp. DW712]|uniref:DUF4269 domain-containing protein n=1 Tax=Myroides sp. DW712 TaxID=3389800 RepID=UPI003979EB6E
MKNDFTSIAYLKRGSAVQQQVYQILTQQQVLRPLQVFTPVVVGTYPLDIAIETSDIDIACQFDTLEVFQHVVQTNFGRAEGFTTTVFNCCNTPTYVANFVLGGFPIEIFAQAVPVTEQYGYRHMLIEHRILEEKGEEFKTQIIAYKKAGLKTEPAFAQVLNLDGDPYEALLAYFL